MASSFFDREIELYNDVIKIIDKKISKGKDIESIKKRIPDPKLTGRTMFLSSFVNPGIKYNKSW